MNKVKENELLACANHLGIDPKKISLIKTACDGGGHFTGLDVIIHISTGRNVNQWVQKNLPEEKGGSRLECITGGPCKPNEKPKGFCDDCGG